MDNEAFLRIALLVCIALAALFIFSTIFSTLVGPAVRRREVNRRLRAMKDSGDGEKVLLALKAERGIGDNLNVIGGLSKLLVQSGLRATSGKFISLMAILFVAVLVSLSFLTLWPMYAKILFSLFLGLLLPIQFVRRARNKRIKKFGEGLPDAIEIIVRSLRSGHPVPVAISLVGREMADPVGTEFGMVVDEMTYGLDLPRAIRNLGDRVGLSDLALLVTAISLQGQSGGNLAEVLGGLAKVLRDRFQLRRKVRALSAEGRMSGWALGFLPILIAGGIFFQVPRYYTDVWDHPMFFPVLAGLGVWSLFGDYIIYRMVNFKY